MAAIEFVNVDKIYKGGVKAVDDLNLQIEDGEFMVFVGPSGCGKTTSLRMIAGLEDISNGEIRIGDRVVNDVPPKDRDIAMVFQNYALYPHMTVRNNLSFGLRLRKMEKQEQDRRVGGAAQMLGLDDYLARRPGALSGGQRQRVAMGRAIVREPQAFLMDEPLSNLDAKLRVSMRGSLNQLHERLGTTTVFVTHDQVEAMTLGDRVAVMRDGRLQQCDSPQNLYDYPVNLFVAGFIGSPSMNFVLARLERDNGVTVNFGSTRLTIPDSVASSRPGLDQFFGKDVVLGIRPPDFEDASLPNVDPSWVRIPVKIDVIEQLGSEINALFVLDAPAFVHRDTTQAEDTEEDGDGSIPLTENAVWTARVNARSRVNHGQSAELAIDTSRVQFFDPVSGLAIGQTDTARLEAANAGR